MSMAKGRSSYDRPLFEIPAPMEWDFLHMLAEKPSDVKVYKNIEQKNWYEHLKELELKWAED